jgi:integrase
MAGTTKATILWYSKIDGISGWRRGKTITGGNGRIKMDVMDVAGREVPVAPDAVFQIRHYVDGKTKFTTIGKDYALAQSKLAAYTASRDLERINATLGIVTPEPVVVTAPRTIADQVAAYLKTKQSTRISPELVTLYERTLKSFQGHLSRAGVTQAGDITQQHVLDYLKAVKEAGYTTNDGRRRQYSPKSMHGRYMAIRGWLDKECRLDVTRLLPAAHKEYGTKPDPKKTKYSEEQIERLLDVCSDYHRAVFTTLLSTGLRYEELAHLRWANVSFAENKITIVAEETVYRTVRDRKTGRKETRSITFSTKNGKGREVPIFPSLRTVLEQWRARNPEAIYVFGTSSDLPDGHWLESLKDYAREAGLNCGVCESCNTGRNDCAEFTIHRLRHTFGHRCVAAGVPLHTLSKWLGHHDVNITAKVYLQGGEWKGADPFAQAESSKVVSISVGVA